MKRIRHMPCGAAAVRAAATSLLLVPPLPLLFIGEEWRCRQLDDGRELNLPARLAGAVLPAGSAAWDLDGRA